MFARGIQPAPACLASAAAGATDTCPAGGVNHGTGRAGTRAHRGDDHAGKAAYRRGRGGGEVGYLHGRNLQIDILRRGKWKEVAKQTNYYIRQCKRIGLNGIVSDIDFAVGDANI